ncbi:MAG: BON domain-containing protein [Burkholderiales bacterium]|nr:BON domain-containing protein [Burkholderiales bacterium]
MNLNHARLAAAVLASLLAAGGLAGCAAAVLGGAAAVGTLATVERRGAQTRIDDQGIELRADNQAKALIGERGRVNIVSYYRKVLLTGEVPTEDDRRKVQVAVAAVPEVAGVVNELVVAPIAPMTQQSDDTLLTGRVKTRLLGSNGVPANSIKIVSERGTVYLMGRLTRAEADLATEAARTTSGVQRVVRVIDFISEGAAQGSSGQAAADPAPLAPAAAAPAAGGAVTHPVTQPTIVQQPPAPQPIQVQTLPPVK